MKKIALLLLFAFIVNLAGCGSENAKSSAGAQDVILKGDATSEHEKSPPPAETITFTPEPSTKAAEVTTEKPTAAPTTEKPTEPPTPAPAPTTEPPTQPPTAPPTASPPTTEAKLNGIHTMSYDNGDKYTGNFVDGIRSGQGTYTWANGTVYTGEFANGSPSGNGDYTYPTTEPPPTQKPTDPPAPKPTDPPVQNKPSSGTVYWVASGEVYHSTSGCPSLSRSKNIQSGTIAESGKSRPCSKCW